MKKQQQTFTSLYELEQHTKNKEPYFFDKATLKEFGSRNRTVCKDWIATLDDGKQVKVIEYKEKQLNSPTPTLWHYDYFDLTTGERYLDSQVIELEKIYE